jgi:hypothetical protein
LSINTSVFETVSLSDLADAYLTFNVSVFDEVLVQEFVKGFGPVLNPFTEDSVFVDEFSRAEVRKEAFCFSGTIDSMSFDGADVDKTEWKSSVDAVSIFGEVHDICT